MVCIDLETRRREHVGVLFGNVAVHLVERPVEAEPNDAWRQAIFLKPESRLRSPTIGSKLLFLEPLSLVHEYRDPVCVDNLQT